MKHTWNNLDTPPKLPWNMYENARKNHKTPRREHSSITSATFPRSAQALTPHNPLICWRNAWTEGELLDDFYDMFQIIKICFSIMVRNIFWGVFKEIRARFRKKFISLLITSSIWPQILALCFNSPTLSLPSVSMSAFWPPHLPPKRQQYQHCGSDPPPPQTCWRNTWTLPKASEKHPIWTHWTPSKNTLKTYMTLNWSTL